MHKGEINISEIIKESYYVQVLQTPTRKEKQKCVIKYLLVAYSILSINSSKDVWSGRNF